MTHASHSAYEHLASPSIRVPDAIGPGEPLDLAEETVLLWQAFSPLPIERRRWALTKGRVERAATGDLLDVTGEVVVVVAGALSTCVGGTALCAELLGPGDVVATGSGRTVSAEWIGEGQVYRTSRADWVETAGVDGLIHLLDAADRRRERLEQGVACASQHLATERVADLLAALHDITGLTAAPLSQERLGYMLGLRRTTVNASCRSLQSSGLTRTVRGQIRLTDVAGLREASCGCRLATEQGARPALSDA